MGLADIYDALNRLFGKPTPVPQETYVRTETNFQQHTVPLLEEIGVYLPPASCVMIVGCGNGVEIDWFAEKNLSIIAVDVSRISVDKATMRSKHRENVTCMLVDDRVLPFINEKFDLIFMHNVCEHILNIEENFSEYFRVLKPGGRLINVFAPLFYSPYGAHLQDALKMPWGHMVFGAGAVTEIRNRYYPGHIYTSDWAGLGLNRITESKYRKIIEKTGFRDEYYEIQTSKNLPLVTHVPLLRNLFIFGIKSILIKPK
jgi:SAM-dependent methyltransferase